MLITISTLKTVSETAAALQAAVEAHNFGVMQVHNLKEAIEIHDMELARECLVFEVWQPQRGKQVLDQGMGVSSTGPCRISLYEEGGKTILATTMRAMFNVHRLEGVVREVEDTIIKIMNDATT